MITAPRLTDWVSLLGYADRPAAHSVTDYWVIVDPAGVIRGIGRSLPTSTLINRVFYLGQLKTTGFLGYICDYNPQIHYVVHSADRRFFFRG